MSEYEELIERLEKLTGPDREVDMAILDAVAGPIERTSRRFVARVPIKEVSGSFIRRRCLPYTASIDAALTLARSQIEFWSMLHAAQDASWLHTQGAPNAFPAIRGALVYTLESRTEQEKV
jgi:hypothetical protein